MVALSAQRSAVLLFELSELAGCTACLRVFCAACCVGWRGLGRGRSSSFRMHGSSTIIGRRGGDANFYNKPNGGHRRLWGLRGPRQHPPEIQRVKVVQPDPPPPAHRKCDTRLQCMHCFDRQAYAIDDFFTSVSPGRHLRQSVAREV